MACWIVLAALVGAGAGEQRQSASAGSAPKPVLNAEQGETDPPAPGLASTDESYLAVCGGSEIELKEPLFRIASAFESQRILYGAQPLSDCSGIFHRLLRAVKAECGDYHCPAVREYRDSRALARWYQEKGELQMIGDSLASADLIKPGAVLFYGRRGEPAEGFGYGDLEGLINHVGVVVEVERDEDGIVSNYHLFHGRRPGKVAGISRWHNREPSHDEYPPYGNGTEQWIAFAPLIGPATQQQ